MPLPANGQNVKLGKGSLLLNTLTAAGNPTGFVFTGNASAISISADVTKSQIYSSTQRSAPLLAENVSRIAYTMTVTLNEYTLENLKKFLLGDSAVKNQALVTNGTKTFEDEEVVPGRYVDLEARRVTNVSVTRDGTEVLVAGTDYRVLSEFGMVELIAGGAIQENDTIVIEYDAPALIIDQIRIAKAASPVCHLLFLADDANQDGAGARDRLEVWRASIAPEGELNVIGDDYGSFQLTFSILSDANHPDDPFGTLDRVRE